MSANLSKACFSTLHSWFKRCPPQSLTTPITLLCFISFTLCDWPSKIVNLHMLSFGLWASFGCSTTEKYCGINRKMGLVGEGRNDVLSFRGSSGDESHCLLRCQTTVYVHCIGAWLGLDGLLNSSLTVELPPWHFLSHSFGRSKSVTECVTQSLSFMYKPGPIVRVQYVLAHPISTESPCAILSTKEKWSCVPND